MNKEPDRVISYFFMQIPVLMIVTISGLIYNIGLLAGPWFEGHLVQCLINIFAGRQTFFDMVRLAVWFICITGIVQFARYLKRFYVRRFANEINRSMKQTIYANMLRQTDQTLQEEGTGALMTKVIADVDACSEGMRKFTTEVFDTGVVLVAYGAMLCYYDWRLALICFIFPPFAYILAEKMKSPVQKSSSAAKKSAEHLFSGTMDCVSNVLLYRVHGCEMVSRKKYDADMTDYEKKTIRSNIFANALPPVYQIVSMAGVTAIIYFGAKNVLHTGWCIWNIASFTTFLNCYIKLAEKSSKAGKLFNAVHKAEVSWQRIKPYMKRECPFEDIQPKKLCRLELRQVGFSYNSDTILFQNVNFSVEPGQIIGITGPIACGKSSLGKLFLGDRQYDGHILLDGIELSEMNLKQRCQYIVYMGHEPELLSDTIEHNILMGTVTEIKKYVDAVCMTDEIEQMPEGINTVIGNKGVGLSGGQQARVALARTLVHQKPVMILDDPFAALDMVTEEKIFEALKIIAKDSIVLIISHRLTMFPKMNQVIWMNNGNVRTANHERLMASEDDYRELYQKQCKGGDHDA